MEDYKLGLSLSGGGYRAAAFHLGTLHKLNDLRILKKVDVLSTISGGSITGAAWCLYRSGRAGQEGAQGKDGDYDFLYGDFHEMMMEKLSTRNVIAHVLASPLIFLPLLLVAAVILVCIYLTVWVSGWTGLVFPALGLLFFVIWKFQYKILPVSRVIERAYDTFFFEGKTLEALCDVPLLAIGSSNLHTGRPFTFSRTKMSDSYYEFQCKPPIRFKHEGFPVSRAVMASSCVPFAFTPVTIDRKYYRVESDYDRVEPVLVDGGVYDNQGIQKLTENKSAYACDIIITSDAGGNFRAAKKYPNTIALLLRTVDLFMYRIKAFQMQKNIYGNVAQKPIAYFSLGWQLDNIIPGFVDNMEDKQVLDVVLDHHQIPAEWRNDPEKYRADIIRYLKDKLGYDEIKKKDLSPAEWEVARTVGTNLTAIPMQKVKLLVRHAQNLTELQVKLYCPMLL